MKRLVIYIRNAYIDFLKILNNICFDIFKFNEIIKNKNLNKN